MSIGDKHKKLKEDGYKEMVDKYQEGMEGRFTPAQLIIVRAFYDYGWYCAYGLQSEDKKHKEVMSRIDAIIKQLDKESE